MKSDARQGNNGYNFLCSKKHIRVFRHQSMLPESVSACKVLRTEQRIKHPSRQRTKHPSRQRIKHLSRHPFHANSWIACIAPHGQNQRVPAKPIDGMYLIAQGRRVYKAREMDYGEREAKETLPINICWKTPDSSLPSKLVSHDKGEGMCGNEHIRVFRHFPNEPCVLACMMLRGELCFPTWKHWSRAEVL